MQLVLKSQSPWITFPLSNRCNTNSLSIKKGQKGVHFLAIRWRKLRVKSHLSPSFSALCVISVSDMHEKLRNWIEVTTYWFNIFLFPSTSYITFNNNLEAIKVDILSTTLEQLWREIHLSLLQGAGAVVFHTLEIRSPPFTAHSRHKLHIKEEWQQIWNNNTCWWPQVAAPPCLWCCGSIFYTTTSKGLEFLPHLRWSSMC